jgi:peptide/nickel transport system substrate-binding protein
MSRSARVTMRNAAVALFAMAAFVFAGCGSNGGSSGTTSDSAPSKGGTLNISIGGEIEGLDPSEEGQPQSIDVLSQIFEPLFRTNRDNEVIPWLVESTKRSADGLTFTFELKKGIKFSSGKPLTAEDVVFSLNRVRKSIARSFMYESIAKTQATGPTTVVVTLKYPVAAFETQLSLFATGIVPKDFEGRSAKDFFNNDPVGTGPFMVGSWKRGESITLERNPNYWRPSEPLLDRVVFVSVPDAASRVSQLRAGELDVIGSPEFAQIESIESSPGLEVGVYAMSRSDYFLLDVANPLFANPKVREAVNLAIDREGIVQATLAGRGKPGASYLGPDILYHNPNIPVPEQNLEKAKELLAEGLAESGASPSFALKFVSTLSFFREAAQIVQRNLNDIGFDVSLEPTGEAAIFEEVESEEFGGYLSYYYSDIVDPSQQVSTIAGGAEAYWTHPKNLKEVMKLSTEAEAELNPSKRRQLYYHIQDVVGAENNILTMDYQPFIWALNEDVAGMKVNVTNLPWLAEVGFSN